MVTTSNSASPESLRALSDAATPGEWKSGGDEVYAGAGDTYEEVGRIYEGEGEDGFARQEANAAFIVAAVNYVRAALQRDSAAPEPTDEEVREYRLDATDPENARLNREEWLAHRALAAAPSEPPALDVEAERKNWPEWFTPEMAKGWIAAWDRVDQLTVAPEGEPT